MRPLSRFYNTLIKMVGRRVAEFTLLAMYFGQCVYAVAPPLKDETDWDAMLSAYDMHWNVLPDHWDEAPFLGNGEQGTLVYQISGKVVRWDVGCSSAHEHKPVEKEEMSVRSPSVLYRGRHNIGHLELRSPVDIIGGEAKLGLWDAEASGKFLSQKGNIEWHTVVHAKQPVMRIEFLAKGDLEKSRFIYVPEQAASPRAARMQSRDAKLNPPAEFIAQPDGVNLVVQDLKYGGHTAVAWLEKRMHGKTVLWLSVKHSYPGSEAKEQALTAVRNAAADDQAVWLAEHRSWWHEYYPASLVSTGDPYWDSFYWAQQYKRACATRDKGWIIDNQGPWLQSTPWNATWWNLNIQLSHSGVNVANRREMGTALSHKLDVLRDNLSLNVDEKYRKDSYAIGRESSGWDLIGHAGEPGARADMDDDVGSECGNLLWALHNVDMEYLYWKDADLRDRVLFPVLVRAVNYYRHFLVESKDGYWHLPATHSPEFANVEDASYDLALLRWGVMRLLEIAHEKGLDEKSEPLIAEWKKIKLKLVPLHVNGNGIMLGASRELDASHRHWSHMIAVYPLRTITPDSEADRMLIEKSLDHWHSFKGALQGYSFTGGASIAACLGDGERAYQLLNGLKRYVRANTMYRETGPVMETPLHGATAMQEMLLQSWGGRLRVFPAVPEVWSDVQIHQLRGEGAYLVSARREKKSTKWVMVQSEAGGTVEVDPQLASASWEASEGTDVTNAGDGIYRVKAAKGAWILFWPAGQNKPDLKVNPVPAKGEVHKFGVRQKAVARS